MPYELHIPIHVPLSVRPKLAEQRGMHALFLSVLQAVDSDLAYDIHEQPIKPFTQAILPIDGSDKWQWRVTLMQDELYTPFCQGLSQLTTPHLMKRPLTFHLAEGTCHHQTYSALAKVRGMDRYRLSFHTPTTFKQRYYHHPIPDPYLCFQSWWRRWQAFAPADLGINIALLDIVQAHLVVSYFQIRSQMWQNGQRRVVGATGQMTFLAIQQGKVDSFWWQGAAALAAFARFCGTGHKTTQGLGQTMVQ